MSWIGLIMDILYLGLVCNLNIAFKLHEVNFGVFVNLISLLNYCKNSFYKNKVEGEIVSLWPIMSCNYAFPLEHESRIYSVQDCNLRGLWFLWITMKDYFLCPLRVWHIVLCCEWESACVAQKNCAYHKVQFEKKWDGGLIISPNYR